MEWLGVAHDVTATDTDEDLTGPLASLPPVLARSIAADKARAARAAGSHGTIVACDTIVVLDRTVLGKPEDIEDAWRMLRALSGRVHEVVTGVALFPGTADEPRTFAVTTPVRMRDLADADIEAGAASGELLGCAGAYNIERHLASVDEGECYQNVAGLPLCHLYRELLAEGVEGVTSPVEACEAARGGVTCTLGRRIAARGVRPARP